MNYYSNCACKIIIDDLPSGRMKFGQPEMVTIRPGRNHLSHIPREVVAKSAILKRLVENGTLELVEGDFDEKKHPYNT